MGEHTSDWLFSSGGCITGVNPKDDKSDDFRRLNMHERISTFYKQFGKQRLTSGVGNIVDWTLEHGEEALNKKLRAK